MLTCLVKAWHITQEEQKPLQLQFEKIRRELSRKVRVVPIDGCASALLYQEDDWTEILYHCLHYNKIDAELTARLRGSTVSQ